VIVPMTRHRTPETSDQSYPRPSPRPLRERFATQVPPWAPLLVPKVDAGPETRQNRSRWARRELRFGHHLRHHDWLVVATTRVWFCSCGGWWMLRSLTWPVAHGCPIGV
jgi:hypothetical protein